VTCRDVQMESWHVRKGCCALHRDVREPRTTAHRESARTAAQRGFGRCFCRRLRDTVWGWRAFSGRASGDPAIRPGLEMRARMGAKTVWSARCHANHYRNGKPTWNRIEAAPSGSRIVFPRHWELG